MSSSLRVESVTSDSITSQLSGKRHTRVMKVKVGGSPRYALECDSELPYDPQLHTISKCKPYQCPRSRTVLQARTSHDHSTIRHSEQYASSEILNDTSKLARRFYTPVVVLSKFGPRQFVLLSSCGPPDVKKIYNTDMCNSIIICTVTFLSEQNTELRIHTTHSPDIGLTTCSRPRTPHH